MFPDRETAGCQLGQLLQELALEDPLVLGIPRGGVVVAAAIASCLNADLDVVLARKIRAPLQPEFALGAIGEDGRIYVKRHVEQYPGVTHSYLEQEQRRCYQEMERQRDVYRAAAPPVDIADRSVVLVDDGLATGSTMFAALEVVRSQRPRKLIVAVPVGAPDTIAIIRQRCDRVVCLEAPVDFEAVGRYYRSFSTVTEDQVVGALEAANRRQTQ